MSASHHRARVSEASDVDSADGSCRFADCPVKAAGPFSCSEEAARLIEACASAESREAPQRRRERIALAVFAVLVLAGFVMLTSYISNAGRGLNVAATSIDDMAGDMAGYDVLLFEGTVRQAPSSSRSDFEGAAERAEGTAPSALGASSERLEGASDAPASSDAADDGTVDDGVMTVDEARAIYEGKSASVIEVDPDSLRDYVSGRIVMKDGHSYGIFSLPPDMASEYAMPTTVTTKTTTTIGSSGAVDEKTTARVKSAYDSVSELFAAIDPDSIDPALVERIQTVIGRFEAAKVDTVVAFTCDPTPFSAVEGVDAVITFKTRDRFSMSEVIGKTLYFDAPEEGSVGVLMVAPGNVASTKVLTEN